MPLPESIGIIPDGNRRFAKRLMARPWKGHEWGVQKLEQVCQWANEAGVRAVTFYALSLENLRKRPERELRYLYRLLESEIDRSLKPGSRVHRDKTRVHVFGHLELLPASLQQKIAAIQKATERYNGPFLQFAIAYGGRQELVDVMRAIAEEVRQGRLAPAQIDEATIE